MKKVNVNVAGNVNIFVPVLSGNTEEVKALLEMFGSMEKPEEETGEMDALLDFLKDFMEECEEPEEEEDDEDVEVIVATPGKDACMKRIEEGEEMVEKFGCHFMVLPVPVCDLMLCCDSRQVLNLGDEKYLVGSAIVYACDKEENYSSIRTEDAEKVLRFLKQRTVTLCGDSKAFHAYHLWEE